MGNKSLGKAILEEDIKTCIRCITLKTANSVIDNAPALVLACKVGNYYIVSLLLENGANVNARDGMGNTPLIMAITMGINPELTGGNQNAMDRSYSVSNLLLNHGANVNATNKRNETALIIASKNWNNSLCRLLLNYGAYQHENFACFWE